MKTKNFYNNLGAIESLIGTKETEHIVKCVNNNELLVKVLREVLNNLTNDNLEEYEIKARDILKQAGV